MKATSEKGNFELTRPSRLLERARSSRSVLSATGTGAEETVAERVKKMRKKV